MRSSLSGSRRRNWANAMLPLKTISDDVLGYLFSDRPPMDRNYLRFDPGGANGIQKTGYERMSWRPKGSMTRKL